MALRNERRGSVLLAIDLQSLTLPALEAAVALSAGLRCALRVLFVADQPLPAEAEHLRRMVAEQARQFGIRWGFERARGDSVAAAFGRLRPRDALVMHRGPPASFPIAAQPPFSALDARPVLVLFDASAAASRALAAGDAMARVIGTELAVLIAGNGAADAARRDAERRLAAPGGRLRFIPARSSAAALARLARDEGAGALVWSATPPAFAELLDQVGCPLVAVPAAGAITPG